MLDNSVSVIAAVSKSFKKYLFALSMFTQALFIAYYVYLSVTNFEATHLFILYISILVLAVAVMFIDIFTLDITSFKTRYIKGMTKRFINGASWIFKLGVIGYNIYLITQNPVTETGLLFLIFTSLFLVIQVIASLFSWLISYYSELFMYALKMDYENIIDEDADPNQRPIGQALNKVTSRVNHKDKINELSVKHELFSSIKDELEKDNQIKIRGKVVRRKTIEKIILHYYDKACSYYISQKKINSLIDNVHINLESFIYEDDKAFLLDFFLENYHEKVYIGLSEHATKLIIACFLFLLDDYNKNIVDVVYKSLLKEIIDIKTWSVRKEENLSSGNLNIDRALAIAKDTKTQYELYKEETVGSEFESIIFKIIKDSAIENGRIKFKRKIRHFFGLDK